MCIYREYVCIHTPNMKSISLTLCQGEMCKDANANANTDTNDNDDA